MSSEEISRHIDPTMRKNSPSAAVAASRWQRIRIAGLRMLHETPGRNSENMREVEYS
jgi:hypothetical protein